MSTNNIQQYPYDPTGIAPENLITGEEHTLSAINGDNYHVIIPRLGPFFSDGLVVNHPVTGDPLELGVDYTFTHLLEQLSLELNKTVYSSITILDKSLVGTITVDYQNLGGEYLLDLVKFLEEISELVLFIDTRNFDDIWDVPEQLPFIDHNLPAEDLIGMSEVVEAVNELRDAVAGNYEGNHTHSIESIIGLDEAIQDMATNRGNHKLAPANGYSLVEHQGALGIILPQFTVDTRIQLQLCILSKDLPSTIWISGKVGSKLSTLHGESWTERKAVFTGTKHTDEVRLTYNEDNFPVILLGDQVNWNDVHLVIQNVTIDSTIPQKYQAGWGVFAVNGVIGDSIDIERIEGLDDLTRKVQMLSANTIFDEPLFDII